MNRLNGQEHEEKHVRIIALKDVGHKDYHESSVDSDGETLNLLTRKFSKFFKNPLIGITTRNSMILMLTNVLVLDVVNKVILKLIS